jgi:hypothetical protein
MKSIVLLYFPFTLNSEHLLVNTGQHVHNYNSNNCTDSLKNLKGIKK